MIYNICVYVEIFSFQKIKPDRNNWKHNETYWNIMKHRSTYRNQYRYINTLYNMNYLQTYIHISKNRHVVDLFWSYLSCLPHFTPVPWCDGWCKPLRVFLQVWMCCPLRSGEWVDSSSFGAHGVAYQEDLEEGRPAGVHYSLRHEWLLRLSGRRIAKLRGGQKLDGVGLAWVEHIWVEGETVWVDF